MKVLILGLNYAPEPVGIAAYTTPMAEGLVARGHAVTVVTADPSYPHWSVIGRTADGGRRVVQNGVEVTRVPVFVPRRPTVLGRLGHQASFALTALPPLVATAWAWRPDVVMTIAPGLIAAPVARAAARLCGAHAWLHVQDFEVGAARATGRMPGLAVRLAAGIERAVLGLFPTVSTISADMERRLASSGVWPDRIVSLRNWADPTITPQANSAYRREWGITTPHVVLYSGSLGRKQGLETVLDAAQRLASRADVTFVICGDGPERSALEARARGLPNILFQPLQPRERLGDLLALASVHALPQIAGLGDLLLPSKLTNMLASGRPVVATAEPGTSLAREVETCGLVCPPGDAEALAFCLGNLLDDADLRTRLGAAARRRALAVWNQEAILDALDRDLVARASVDARPSLARPAP
jgi:colanic acid biosynthesis glycosyl transferase WcaI